MSAIAKPLANFTNSTKPSEFIPVEQVIDATAVDIPANPNGPSGTASFVISFTLLNTNSVVRYIQIPFATALARNTSLTNFKSTFSAGIA